MKNNKKISYRLVAYTDAAGKFSPEAYRSGNEDNFYVEDLTDTSKDRVSQDEIIQLGKFGLLMVVADGMGGMNAGEIASQIAVDTVKASFNADSLTQGVVATSQSRQRYLEHIIKVADKNIKTDARKNPDREGMGSTIIMAWLYEDELTISWCGDSRAYLFNEKSGIRLISQDHSYVQELVNKGMLTYDQTFDHPQNNIITRSLGDPTKDAKPESKTIKVGKGDIILLCSDGLSGVLRDRKTYDSQGHLYPEENIEDIIKAHCDSMKECREALWKAAERGGWYDNVTAILCQITEGPESTWAKIPDVSTPTNNSNLKKIVLFSLIGIIIAGAIIGAFFIGRDSNSNNTNEEFVEINDSTINNINENVLVENPENFAETPDEEKIEKSHEKNIKPTVKDQIIQQNEEKVDTTSIKNGLTKINKTDSTKKSSIKDRLTPIQNDNKKENPLEPSLPKNDDLKNNPLNNKE